MPRFNSFSNNSARGFAEQLPLYTTASTMLVGDLGTWLQGGVYYPATGFLKAGSFRVGGTLVAGGAISGQPIQGQSLEGIIYLSGYPGGDGLYLYWNGFDVPPLNALNCYASQLKMGGTTHPIKQPYIGFRDGGTGLQADTSFIQPVTSWSSFMTTLGATVPLRFTANGSAFDPTGASGNIAFSSAPDPDGTPVANGTITNNAGSNTWSGAFALGTVDNNLTCRYCEFTNDGGTDNSVGIVNTAWPANYPVGAGTGGDIAQWGYLNGGTYLHNSNSTVFGPGYGVGDTVMMAVDVYNGRLWFGVNGAWIGGVTPSTSSGTGSIAITGGATTYRAAAAMHQGSGVGKITKSIALRYTIPPGFSPC